MGTRTRESAPTLQSEMRLGGGIRKQTAEPRNIAFDEVCLQLRIL